MTRLHAVELTGICGRCGAPAVLVRCQLGTEELCRPCADTILEPIRDRIAARNPIGHGRQVGPLRLDYGHDWGDLECDRCGATWVGRLNEACCWCEHALAIQREHQKRLALTPPPRSCTADDDQQRLDAWRRRLAAAIDAGTITRAAANRAWRNRRAVITRQTR